jgi:hypothetical protein
MKKLLDIQKANLFKEAFALAIKEQQRIILEQENAIQFGFSKILGGAVVPNNVEKLRDTINDSKQYIEFYSEMYLNAEEFRMAITDKRYEEFARNQKEHVAKFRKANKSKNERKI